MNAELTESRAVELLRDIIEGDDARMARGLEDGKKFLDLVRVAAARPGLGDDMDKIMALVASDHHLAVAAFIEQNRRQDVALARQMAMWLCRKVTERTYESIGERFKRRHGAVMHGCGAVEARRDTDTRFRQRLQRLLGDANEICGRKVA